MSQNLLIGIGGRGTLVCEMLQRQAPEQYPMLCIDSDPALSSAALAASAVRVLLDPKRSPNRSIEYAKQIFANERSRIVDALNDFFSQHGNEGSPSVVTLCSSPRGGISNAFTFEIAQLLRDGPLFNLPTRLVVLAVVPAYNNVYRDVITVNAGHYFRDLQQSLKSRQVDVALLVSEDYLKSPSNPAQESQNRARCSEALAAVLPWLPTEEGRRHGRRLCTLALAAWAKGEGGVLEAGPWRPMFGQSMAAAADKLLLAPPDAAEVGTILRQQFQVSAQGRSSERHAVAVLRFDEHPEVQRFLEAHEVAGMRCWKSGGGACTKTIEYNSRQVFVGMPFKPSFKDIKNGIRNATETNNLVMWHGEEELSNVDLMCKVCQRMQESEFGVIDMTEANPNVMFELGLLYGRGKKVVLLQRVGGATPTDLKGMEVIPYENSDDVREGLGKFLKSAKQ